MKKVLIQSIILCGLVAGTVFGSEVQKGNLRKRVDGLLQSIGVGVVSKEEKNKRQWQLIGAIEKGTIDEVKRLIANGIDVNMPADSVAIKGILPLHTAARSYVKGPANVEIVKLLLDAGAHVNVQNSEGNTPLMLAVSSSNTDVVTLLLARGADVNAKSREGYAALQFAQALYPEIIKILVTAGADVQGAAGTEALVFAAMNGATDLVKFLLDAGANPNPSDGAPTALFYAIRSGNVDLVKLFIARGARVNGGIGFGGENGHTGLMEAAAFGNVEMVKLLLDAGADVNAQLLQDYRVGGYVEKKGSTALTIAAYKGHADVVKLLLAAGADHLEQAAQAADKLHPTIANSIRESLKLRAKKSN